MPKLKVSLATMMALCGCAQIQQQAEVRKLYQEEIIAHFATCKQSIEADRRIDPVRAKISMDPSAATIRQRTSQERITTDAEKAAIEALDDNAMRCSVKTRAIISKYFPPPYIANYDQRTATARALRADLWSAKITYGEYQVRLQEENQRFNDEDARIASRESARTQQESYARQQQVSEAISQSLRDLAAANAATRPAYIPMQPTQRNRIDCQRYSKTGTDCISY